MKKLFLILSLLFLIIKINGQNTPETFYFESEKLYKSTDETPVSNSISDIVIVGDTIWLGTSRGLSRSTDKGKNWTNYYGSNAFGTESISAVGYHNGIIFAATAHSIERDGQTLPEGSGIRYSSNNGETWQTIPQPIDEQNDTIVVYGINNIRALPVTVAVQNLIYDIAFTHNTIWIATFAGGLRKSTDMGTTWQRVVIPPDRLDSIKPTDTLNFALQPVAGRFGPENNLNHRLFSVIAVNDSTIFAGSAGGINISTDYGVSWKKITRLNQSKSISGNFVVAMGHNKNNNSIWAATWRAEGTDEFYGVSVTTDGGESWSTGLNGLRLHNFGFKGNDVIAAATGGAFRSSNNGATWIQAPTIIDDVTRIPITSNIFYSAGASGNDVWLGSTNGLAYLNEAGGIWQGNWKVYLASQSLKTKTETYAYPNPFSPRNQSIKIKYSTGGKRANVTIRVFDFDMKLVKTLIQNAERGDQIHTIDGFDNNPSSGVIDFWDGRNESGNIVPNGVYFYRVDVDSDEPVYGKIIVLS